MDEFEQLKAWLAAWHTQQDHKAMTRFFEGWLQPAVRRAAQRVGLPADAVDDLIQTVALFFSSHPNLATDAHSVGYWRQPIEWKLKDVLRRRGTLRKRFKQPDQDATDMD